MSIENQPSIGELEERKKALEKRINAQTNLAKFFGATTDAEMFACLDENAGLFAQLEKIDSTIVDKLVLGSVQDLDDKTRRFLLDQHAQYDTGREPEDEELIRAA